MNPFRTLHIMVRNVLDPAQTGYIVAAEDLEAFLKEKYGKTHPNFQYNVEVRPAASQFPAQAGGR